MLVRVLAYLANKGNASVVQWLQNDAIPGEIISRIQIFQNNAILETQSKKEIVWTNGTIHKLLSRGRPAKTIPVIMEICRLYDLGIELDKFLSQYLENITGKSVPILPFCIENGKIVTFVASKNFDVKGCKALDRNTIQLNSSRRLRKVLLSLLEKEAL